MIRLKVYSLDDRLGVELPKEVIARLNAKAGLRLFLTETADGGYRLLPYNPEFERKMVPAEDLVERYRETILRLAR